MSSIVFSFGRVNPPTLGHERLINRVVEIAKERGCDHIVYLSQTQRNTTDPLDWHFKLRVCRAAFRGVKISNNTDIKNPYIALEHLKDHYTNIVLVAGSDQVDEYRKRFLQYAERWGVSLEIVSAGDRSNNAAGVEGISATKMREYARNDNRALFLENLPSQLSQPVRLLVYKKVKTALKQPKR